MGVTDFELRNIFKTGDHVIFVPKAKRPNKPKKTELWSGLPLSALHLITAQLL